MQIRALTGFSEKTIRNYGRSYSPLSGYGGKTIIGAMNPIGGDGETQTLPTSIPEQTVTVKNRKTGEIKTYKVQNIKDVISLLYQGFMLLSSLRGGSGQQVVNIPPPAETKGISTEVLIGLGAVALIFLMMNRR